MSVFSPVDFTTLKDVVSEAEILHLFPRPTPCNLFESIFSCLNAKALQIVNCSFQSGMIYSFLKTSQIKPLLKRYHWDPSILNTDQFTDKSQISLFKKKKILFNAHLMQSAVCSADWDGYHH